LARNRRPPALRGLGRDFFTGCRLGALFETALAPLTTFGVDCPSAAAFPAIAPTTPPTTAPIGPAMLPAAAPATAPAVCFGIGGIWMFSDDCEFSSFFAFLFLGIKCDFLISLFPGRYFRRRSGVSSDDLKTVGNLP
jgi:hypothetical protein